MLGQNKSAWQDLGVPATEAAHDDLLEQIVGALCRRGLRDAALVTLEAGRPLAFIAGQLLWMSRPLLSIFVSASKIGVLAEILEDPQMLAELTARLEANGG
jgi:hypothetical protein